jgi:tRNA(Ile)-lysidine synthase
VLKQLEQSIRRHRLVQAGERVGVAVSGGPDSVALLRAFADLAPSLGVVLVVLHLNHHLRGAESDADQDFVAALAEKHSLEAVLGSADIGADGGPSLEAAGRRARYAFFLHAAADHRLDCVATGHTRDDQAETILLRLLRGSGSSGLSGILRSCDLSALAQAPVPVGMQTSTPPRLIRPMLSISRRQVERYLLSLSQPFRLDPSNRDPKFLRNRVRAELLPALERDYNPQLRQALCETADIAAAENALLEELVSAALARLPHAGVDVLEAGIDVPFFQAQQLALQRRILRRLCRPHGLALDFMQLENLREFALGGCAGSLQLPRGFTAEIVRRNQLPPRFRLLAP